MAYRFSVPRPFKDSEEDFLEFDDDVPMDEAIAAADKYHTQKFFDEGIHMALGALIKKRITSEDFFSGMGDKLGDTMETLNMAVKGKNKYSDPLSESYNPEYGKSQEDAVNEIMTLVGLGGRSVGAEGGAGTAGMFIGKKAMGAGAVKKFEDAEALGKTKESLWNEFGIFRGDDGQIRGEIPDDMSSINPKAVQFLDISGMAGQEVPLRSVLTHKTLYNFYPELKDVKVKLTVDKSLKRREGEYDPNSGTITVKAPTIEQAHNTILHEIQHKVQEIEGFARGGNPDTLTQKVEQFNDIAGKARATLYDDSEKLLGEFDFEKYPDAKTISDIEKTRFEEAAAKSPDFAKKYNAYKDFDKTREKIGKITHKDNYGPNEDMSSDYAFYRDLYGEMEARNTQYRRYWSQEERANTPPWFTEDTPETGSKYVIKKK